MKLANLHIKTSAYETGVLQAKLTSEKRCKNSKEKLAKTIQECIKLGT